MYLDEQQLPARHHPVAPNPATGSLVADTAVTVWAHQLRATNVPKVLEWTDGVLFYANGGPVVLVAGQVAGLGDWVVRDEHAQFEVVPADLMFNRYQPAQAW